MRNLVRKVNSIIDVSLKKEKSSRYPWNLQVDPSCVCNLRCKTCVSARYKEKWGFGQGLMSLDVFKKLVDAVNPIMVPICSMGEPFMNPDLLKMINYLSSQNIYSTLTTNGTLMLKEHSAEEIVSSGLDMLRVSIDAANPSTYEKIRGQDFFNTIINNIKAVNHQKKQAKRKAPEICFEFVVQKDNLNELVDLVELAEKIGVRRIHYRVLNVDFLSQEAKQAVVINPGDEKKIFNSYSEISRLSKKYNVITDFKRYTRLYRRRQERSLKQERFICMAPWTNLFCDVDGDVMPCTIMDRNPDKKGVLGNICSEGRDLLAGEDIQAMRKEFETKENYKTYYCCSNCTQAYSLGDIVEIGRGLAVFR